MIFGIGIDLLNIERIKKLYKKYNEKLLNKILTDIEINYLNNNKKNKLNFLAKRFCIKEAFSKAVGTGIGKYVNLKDISCINNELGKPYILCSKNLIKFLETKFNIDFNKINIDVSVSDDMPFVNAIIIISNKE